MRAGALWRRFQRRLIFLLSHGERQRQLWEEMEFHIESMARDLIEAGLPEADAHAASRRKFGNMTQQLEDSRNVWVLRWWSDLAQDLRHSIRGMRRDIGFTVFAILITGFGIGASSTVFSVVNALLLRPLPFREPDRLVSILNVEWNTQVDQFLDLRAQNRSLAGLAGWAGGNGAGGWQLTGSGEPERVTAIPVTQNFFPLLGVAPELGAGFTAEDCNQRADAPPVVLLSHAFWRRRFAADPSVAGQRLILNDRAVSVAGVLPASFDFAALFAPGVPVDIFMPWPLTGETNRRGNTLKMIGRLKPGVSAESARAELKVLAERLNREHPDRNPVLPALVPLEQRINGPVLPALFLLGCAVATVMLIVCANLSNMQLARLGTKQRELALRAALGAGRLRLLRQMLTESIVLACCGAMLGLLLAIAGARTISHLTSFNLPLLSSVRVDGAVLAFTLGAAVLTGVLFGVLPAMQASLADMRDSLQEGARGLSGGRRRAWLRNGLVVAEIAFACVLLVCSGLLARSFVRVLDIDLGFEPAHTAVLRVDPGSRIPDLAQQNAFLDEMLRRAQSVPGVSAAGVIDILPFGGDRSWQVGGKGQIYPMGQHPEAHIRVVSDGYFEAAGIRLRSGRAFSEHDRDSSEPVAIVNQTLANTLWPGQDPLGQTMTQDGGRRVIGVVSGIRHEILEQTGGPELYLPLRQTKDYGAMQLVLRSTIPPPALAPGIRAALRPLDPNLPMTEIQSLRDLVDQAVSPRRFLVVLLGGFAAFALLLASLGIYAVISYSVNQRAQEIGIRVALGASPARLQYSILVNTFGLAALGLALGLTASRVASSALGKMLYGVSSGDPLTYAGAGALLIAVAALAGYVPAWRASRTDPLATLRSTF
jgi:predicted permease